MIRSRLFFFVISLFFAIFENVCVTFIVLIIYFVQVYFVVYYAEKIYLRVLSKTTLHNFQTITGWMIFHFCLRASGRLVDLGTSWASEPKDYYFYHN